MRLRHGWAEERDWRRRLFKAFVQVMDTSRTKFFSITNITTESITASLLPTDFNLQAWCRGPWLQFFTSRKMEIDSPTDALLESYMKPAMKPYRLQRSNNPFFTPDAIKEKSMDYEEVRHAVGIINEDDPMVADLLWDILDALFPRGDPDRRVDQQLWNTFYEYHEKLLFSNPRHDSPPPDIVTKPIISVFSNGSQQNQVLTTKPSFAQALMSPSWPIKGQDFSTFAVLVARISELQRQLRLTGQIPVTCTPDLRIISGFNPSNIRSRIMVDWHKWSERETVRAETLDIFGSFESCANLVSWHDKIELTMIYLSPDREAKGRFRAQQVHALTLATHLASPLAAPCLFMQEWCRTTSSPYSTSQGTITYRSILPRDWAKYSGLSHGDMIALEDLIMVANDRLNGRDNSNSDVSEVGEQENIFANTFFPIVGAELLGDQGKPLILWPSMRISLPFPTDLSISLQDRRVTEGPIPSPSVSILTLLDRVVFSENPTKDHSLLSLLLENPFSHLFNGDRRATDIWEARWRKIEAYLNPPISKDSNAPSAYNLSLERLKKILRWAEILASLSTAKLQKVSIGEATTLAPELPISIIFSPEVLFDLQDPDPQTLGTLIPQGQRRIRN